MSVLSSFLYSEKFPVSMPNLWELADPFEADSNRRGFRVVGFLLAKALGVGGIFGAMLADAYVDRVKMKKIRSKIDQLDIAVRDPKPKTGLFLQRKIGSSIQTYTDRSIAIKTASGIAGIAGNLLHVRGANGAILLVGFVGFCYSVFRRYTEGRQLQADNLQLALASPTQS
jgi:hypothetical protein